MSDGGIRLGCVKYLNAQPLVYGWPGPIVYDHPSVLCRQLAEGELDVALVSSFEYLANPVYTIVDDVAVAADGAVHSVLLAHREPVEEIAEIHLDPASRTSVNLLQCLLADRGLQPAINCDPSATAGQARLLIGDQALRFRTEQGDAFRYWDLAEEWKRSTGLPFVFALWLIRPEVPDAAGIAAKLRDRRDNNLRALDEIIAAQTDFLAEFCNFYFRECLRFHFAENEKAGLMRFHSLCRKHGLLSGSDLTLRVV